MSTLHTHLIVGGTPKSRAKSLASNSPGNIETINLSPEEDSPTIGVAQVRNFIHLLWVAPVTGFQKIGIIDPADALTPEAQNALLKTLEEPPQNTDIFLLSQNQTNLLSTLLSRCEIISLAGEHPTLTVDAISQISKSLTLLAGPAYGPILNLALNVSKNRQEAQDWLDELLLFLHSSITHPGSTITSQPNIANIIEAKKRLKANSNVRLTMENLFLNW